MQLTLPFGEIDRADRTAWRLWILAQDQTSDNAQGRRKVFLHPETGAGAFGPRDILMLRVGRDCYQLYLPERSDRPLDPREAEWLATNSIEALTTATKPESAVTDFLSVGVSPGRARQSGVLERNIGKEARTELELLLFKIFATNPQSENEFSILFRRAIPFIESKSHPLVLAILRSTFAKILFEKWKRSSETQFLYEVERTLFDVERALYRTNLHRLALEVQKEVERFSLNTRQLTLPGFTQPIPHLSGRGMVFQRVSGFPLCIGRAKDTQSASNGRDRDEEIRASHHLRFGHVHVSDGHLLSMISSVSDPVKRIAVHVSPSNDGFRFRVGAYDEFALFAQCRSDELKLENHAVLTNLESHTVDVQRLPATGTDGDEYLGLVSTHHNTHKLSAQATMDDGVTTKVEFSVSTRLDQPCSFF